MAASVVLPTATAVTPMRSSSPPSMPRGRVTRALLAKNWIVKKRHPFATMSELLNPLLCILLFAFLKTLEPDLDIPGGWATTSSNKTAGPTVGSSWNLYAETNLLSDLNSSLAGLGMSSVLGKGTSGNGSTGAMGSLLSQAFPQLNSNMSIEELLNSTLPQLNITQTSPLSLLTLVPQLWLPRFYFTETTMPGLMLNMGLQSLSEADRLGELVLRDLLLCVAKFLLLGFTSTDPLSLYYLPAECKGKVVPYKLAIAPDTLYTRKYVTRIFDEWYPRLPLIEPILGLSPLTAPSFADSRVLFANETAFEAYLQSEDYGLDIDHPKIYAAITFQEFPQTSADIGDVRGHDMSFSIRMNSTYTDTSFPNSVPRTISLRSSANKFVRSVKSQNSMIYSTRGFLTLQTAVMRVLNCLPPWDMANERVKDVEACQITQSTMDDSSEELDDRLLRQLEGDVVIGKLARLGSAVSEALADPGLLNGTANTTAMIAKALKTLSTPTTTVANIPDSTKYMLLRVLRQAPQAFHGASVFMSPTEAFHYAGFYQKVLVVFPVLFILSYLYGVSRVIVALLMEKETRSREFMKILGIHDYQIISTWLMTYVQLFFLSSLLQTVGASFLLFVHSSGVLLFIFFLSFALSSFGFGFLVSTLFNRARAGSFVGMGVFFMMFFVSFSFKENSTEAARTLSCLFSPVALSQGVTIIAQLESIAVGVQFANAHDNVGGFRFMSAVYMQLLDFVLYMAVGWYLEKVMPKEYGVSERWYFLLSPAYWRRARRGRRRQRPHQWVPPTEETALAILSDQNADTRRTEEQVAPELKQQEQDDRAIVISRLRKVFDVPGGSKVAVHGLDLALYEGQITCLLGHNGAGKTTLMSMLTGMIPPTSGDARIRGVSILDGMDTIRESLGYCPQFSVVYPELTVEEHLRFYARVKQTHALPRGGADSVDRMIREVGLTEKRGVMAHALSGGMKRKLSLAISFLGDNRVVFLDEPTSGMDPYSRRSTWELIQRNKAGRVVILTTHFMDEADLLGDRIAIMAEGELRCVGSSLFLKQRYGVGYRLSFVVQAVNKKAYVDEKQFVALVQGHVAEARLATDIGTELTFQLPFEASSQFPALFNAIDERRQALGIASYAISVTTLEEIFLKVAETRVTTDELRGEPRNGHVVMPVKDAMEKKIESVVAEDDLGNNSASHGRVVWFLIQLRALLLKRLLSASRDRAMLFYSTLLPIVILFAGLSALRFSLFIQNDPRIELTPVGQFARGAETPLPVACVSAGGAPSNASGSAWCEAALAYFPDAVPSRIHVEPIVYDGAVSPTVFNLPYVKPTIAPNDTTGYCVRYAQLAFQRGYGKDSESMAMLPTQSPVEGQYGGLMLQATARERVLSYNVMVNSSASHGAPTYKALADQAIHNFLLATHSANESVAFRRVRVATHPFPLSFKTRSIFGSFLSLPAVIFVLIAFTFIPAAMMPFLVKEKQHESNARHQQLLSGVSLSAYWLANLIFDLLLYVVPMVIAIILLRFYNISSSLSGSNADAKTCTACTRDVPQAVIALFALFGTAIAPWTYLMSHFMHDAGACLLYTVMLNFLFGIVLLLMSYSLDSLDSTRAANHVLVFFWRLSPLFSLANGLLRVILADIQALFGFNSVPLSAFSKDIAGYEIVYLAIEGPVFFVLALVVDLIKTGELTLGGRDVRAVTASWRQRIIGCGNKTPRYENGHRGDTVATDEDALLVDDEDVRAERARVLEDASSKADDVVHIAQLSKTYANGKRALRNLTFGLQRGDCFGFLGINGAGKTTTMKILTGDLFPTQGSAALNGFDILHERARVRQSIGYCPQFDALLDLLTVREHLELFGRLKGFSGARLERNVQRLLAQFQLHAFERKLAGSLSGGNKRKLSVAIAMLGEPVLLFLDEPSTGMDPFSRRFMWDIILQVSVQSRKSTVVLTTHSMEECEALCNRAGIMVGGRLQCFGTIPHLKTRFGDGFLLECKLEGAGREALDALIQQLEQCGLVRRDGSDSGREIPSAQIRDACSILGAPERAHWILPETTAAGTGATAVTHPTGVALYEQLQRSSELVGQENAGLDAYEFGAWWLLEDRVVALWAFLVTHFGSHGSVAMLERQVDFCRFKLAPAPTIPATSSATAESTSEATARPFALARMFRLLEDARRELGVKEYSIAQTSLEQIFNGFARQQDEEKDVARAFAGGAK